MKTKTEIEYLDPKKLTPDPNNPRKTWSDEHVTSLAKNFAHEGNIHNPIEVDESNMIVCGEMRWRAAIEAGMEKVPVKRVSPKSPEERLFMQVEENLPRGATSAHGVTAWDMAVAFDKLLGFRNPVSKPLGGRPPSGAIELSEDLGCSAQYINEHLYLIRGAPDPLKEAAQAGAGMGAIRAVKRAPDEYREELAEKVRDTGAKTEVVKAVAEALNERPGDAETASAIMDNALKAKTSGEAETAIRVTAPTIGEALSSSLNKAEYIKEMAGKFMNALRSTGTLDQLSRGQRPKIRETLAAVRLVIEEFEGLNDSQLIEGEVVR